MRTEGCALRWPAYFILTAVTVLTFWPCLFAGFLNYDDPQTFFNNPLVFSQDRNILWQVFSQVERDDFWTYTPLTICSFVLEQKLFGVVSFVSHLINLLLHIACSWLVLVLALRMGLSRTAAFLAALLFAVHPMRVESVAWVTERKDVLFGFFYLGALIVYWDYVTTRRRWTYTIALLGAVASMLAKPMALSLPFVLFLLDERAGRRWTPAAFWDKVPFVLALWPIAAITFQMDRHFLVLNWPDSLGLFLWSATFYIGKFFWPVDVSVFYPTPALAAQFAQGAAWLALVGGMTWALRRDGWWRFAILFYVVTMCIFWRTDLSYGIWGQVHDRFMYIPGLGFTFFLGICFDRWQAGRNFKAWGRAAWLGAGLIIAGLSAVTFNQCFVWQNPWTYWREVLERAPDNHVALLNRAQYLIKGGARKDYGWPEHLSLHIAKGDLERAVKVAPRSGDVWHSLGIVLTLLDDAGAEEVLSRALRLSSRKADVYNTLGNLHLRKKDWQKALWNYDQALELRPSYPEVMRNRSLLLRRMREDPLRSVD